LNFIGIKKQKVITNTTIHLMQPGHIEQIIKDVGLQDARNFIYSTADFILYPDKHGTTRIDTWRYCPIIRRLNYLVQNT
jgi:hypothetical protein